MTWLHRSVQVCSSASHRATLNSSFQNHHRAWTQNDTPEIPPEIPQLFFVFRPSPDRNENTCGGTSTVQDWSREADSNGFSGTNWLEAAHANYMACESSAPEACFQKYASRYSCRSSSKHFNPTAWLRQSLLQIVISAYLGRLQQLTSDDRAQPQQPQFSRPRAQVLHLMAAVIGWRTSPWIGSSHWSPMSRTSVPTEMTHRLTMIPERIGDLGPHEDRDPN